MTYEGAVNLDCISDLNERRALSDQINNFGQIPSQLTDLPHPKRKRKSDEDSQLIRKMVINLKDSSNFCMISSPKIDDPNEGPSENIAFFGFDSITFHRVYLNGSRFLNIFKPLKLVANIEKERSIDHVCFLNSNSLLIAGVWDNSIRHVSLLNGSKLQTLIGHQDLITCIDYDANSRVIASGSKDTSVIIWQTYLVDENLLVNPDNFISLYGHFYPVIPD